VCRESWSAHWLSRQTQLPLALTGFWNNTPQNGPLLRMISGRDRS
jgi:hypothetical protein